MYSSGSAVFLTGSVRSTVWPPVTKRSAPHDCPSLAVTAVSRATILMGRNRPVSPGTISIAFKKGFSLVLTRNFKCRYPSLAGEMFLNTFTSAVLLPGASAITSRLVMSGWSLAVMSKIRKVSPPPAIFPSPNNSRQNTGATRTCPVGEECRN